MIYRIMRSKLEKPGSKPLFFSRVFSKISKEKPMYKLQLFKFFFHILMKFHKMEKNPDWKFNSKQCGQISINFMSKVSHWYNVQKIQKTLKCITLICKNLQFVMIDSVQLAHYGNNGSAPYGKFQHSNQCQAVLKMRDRYPPAINLSI